MRERCLCGLISSLLSRKIVLLNKSVLLLKALNAIKETTISVSNKTQDKSRYLLSSCGSDSPAAHVNKSIQEYICKLCYLHQLFLKFNRFLNMPNPSSKLNPFSQYVPLVKKQINQRKDTNISFVTGFLISL